MDHYTFELFADYFQFYLQDEQTKSSWADSWTDEASAIGLALAPGTIVVGTARNFDVPVEITILDAPHDDDFSAWDRVNECSIDVPSGRIVVAGCTDYRPDAARISVRRGCYRARIYYGGLDTVSPNQLEGNDHYRIVLWSADYAPLQILKRFDAT
jgi:hypothetical protein